jgi:hypothetical protein
MATLSELVETVAKAEGMDPATVSLIARNVRERGLITTGGRGTSAGKMTFLDAAHLLIGVNASDRIQDAARTVRTYGELKNYSGRTPSGYKLVDALTELIKAASREALPPWYVSDLVPPRVAEDFSKGQAEVIVDFQRPGPFVQIGIIAAERGSSLAWGEFPFIRSKKRPSILYGFTTTENEPGWLGKPGDRYDMTRIGYPTIRAVAKLFASEDVPATLRSASSHRRSKR